MIPNTVMHYTCMLYRLLQENLLRLLGKALINANALLLEPVVLDMGQFYCPDLFPAARAGLDGGVHDSQEDGILNSNSRHSRRPATRHT